MGDISKDFSFKEFMVSRSFPTLAAELTLSRINKYKVYILVKQFLQPLRDAINEGISDPELNIPITIESGIRSAPLNVSVGGVNNSDHLFTNAKIAVDFKVGSLTNNLTANYLELVFDEFYKSKNLVKQLLYYLPVAGNFFHLSMVDGSAREWDIKYCAQRGYDVASRQYFNSLMEANTYVRNL